MINDDGTNQLLYVKILPIEELEFSNPIYSDPETYNELREFPYGDELEKIILQNDTSGEEENTYYTELWFNKKAYSRVRTYISGVM